jgi:hypothetical protein
MSEPNRPAAGGSSASPGSGNEDRPQSENAVADGEHGTLAPMDFSTFILSLGSSVMVHLGLVDGPDGHRQKIELAAAKQMIDILGLLENKTRGNLTEAEDKLLKSLLYDLRVQFVDAQHKSPRKSEK